MSLLLPLTGVPIPHTPAYKVSGDLDYTKQKIVFRNFAGQVGSSDLEGTIGVVPGKVATVDADLRSKQVDLADLGGFIGTDAGHKAAPGAKPAVAKGDILPSTPINIPKVKAANVHLSYRGDHIENRSVPLDNIVAKLDIDDGVIDLSKLDFKVGTGEIYSHARLDPVGKDVRTSFHVDFHRLDLSRLLAATHTFNGEGHMGGKADVNGTGSSIAGILGDGNGGITLVLSGTGNISALLHDIAGLELGNAILSALGLPNRADLRCFVLDMPLKDGILSTNAFLLQSSEARSVGQGSFNLRDQTANFSLTTRSSHFSIGSLPGPINVTGKLGSPSIAPGAEVIGRTAGAVGLGILFPPAAILPTVQFGVGEGACQGALQEVHEHGAATHGTTAASAGSTAAAPKRRHRGH
ncbi:MAG: AsmA family protein [Gluconacetobacter diazotrophicus]|nr:AsmA family protein [Gluconacetobacter diazotrophicus]